MKIDCVAYAKLLLASISYKPGWEFLISETYDSKTGLLSDRRICLTVSHREPDVTNPEHFTTIVCNQMIDAGMLEIFGVEWFKYFIFEIIREAEMHELIEWLKFDGANFEDPHPPRFRMKLPSDMTLIPDVPNV